MLQMAKRYCSIPWYEQQKAVSLTRSDGHRKDKMLEQTGRQNQNSSVWQKELCLAFSHNAASKLQTLLYFFTLYSASRKQSSLSSTV